MLNLWRPVTLMALLASLLLGESAPAQAKPVRGVSCPTGTAQVVLDPGHGGTDTGAVNATYRLVEKDLTLQVATRAAQILSASYSVALTRYDDQNLGNSERGEVVNACGALVFVEIHLNGSSNTETNYTKTFWGKKRKDLAFSTTMNTAMNALNIPNNGVGQFANGGPADRHHAKHARRDRLYYQRLRGAALVRPGKRSSRSDRRRNRRWCRDPDRLIPAPG